MKKREEEERGRRVRKRWKISGGVLSNYERDGRESGEGLPQQVQAGPCQVGLLS